MARRTKTKKVSFSDTKDAVLLAKLEALVIDLAEAFECAEAHVRCSHERWTYLLENHGPTIANLGAAAVRMKIRRDKGKCGCCGGDAEECYHRHAEGRSCA